MKILFVDDSKAVHHFLKDCFTGKNHELDHAYSGEEAVEKLIGDGAQKYDLVLLDWEMPGIKGPDVLQQIKEKDVQTTVIMLTSRNSADDIAKVLELGAAEYIMKPFTADVIFEKMEAVLGT